MLNTLHAPELEGLVRFHSIKDSGSNYQLTSCPLGLTHVDGISRVHKCQSSSTSPCVTEVAPKSGHFHLDSISRFSLAWSIISGFRSRVPNRHSIAQQWLRYVSRGPPRRIRHLTPSRSHDAMRPSSSFPRAEAISMWGSDLASAE